jgi:hypothetical protein
MESTATLLSGKYADVKDAHAQLAAMTEGLHHRKVSSGPGRKGEAMADLQTRLLEAKRKGDHDLARQLSNEIVKTRK